MKGNCPNCERVTELEFIQGVEDIIVRGEPIPVSVEYLKCTECGTEFNDPNSQKDPLDAAYREYRQRHGLLQPEKIKELRERYGLNQQEMSALLGWGGATLSRYENGALQDEAHETILKLIQEPHNLLELIEEKPDALTIKRKERIVASLREFEGGLGRSLTTCLEELYGNYAPNKYCGYKPLNTQKLLNSMIFFCKDQSIPKTKLNKLMFYADFKHCKDYSISITGARYAHLPYGPAPDHYEYYVAALNEDEKSILIEEVQFNDYSGEYLLAIKDPILSIFSTTELKILAMVKEHFSDFTAKKISEASHLEKGYIETKNSDLISYDYAQFLSI